MPVTEQYGLSVFNGGDCLFQLNNFASQLTSTFQV